MLLQLAAGAVATGREHESRENLQTETVLPTTTTERERTTNVLSDIADIALPPRIQKRGRPKGSELTVIGLPKKRLKLHKSKCVAFERMSDIQKQSFVLSWFVDQRVIDKCVTEQHLIQEDEVEINPDLISLACKKS